MKILPLLLLHLTGTDFDAIADADAETEGPTRVV